MEGRSTAENEAAKIIQVLNEHPIDTSRIGALVFDTMAVNSGVKSGVVVRLETEFGRSLLQLACRHHIHDLVGGASCSIVYGPTTGPNEQLFKRLLNTWSELDQGNYTLVEVSAQQRELAGHVHATITFLQTWMENSTKETLRHDYLELAHLTLLFLGGTVPDGMRTITIKAPGAFHHARWMSKTLYTIKVALFRRQLGDIYTPEELEDITSLAAFMSVFYTKAWLTCTSAADAPSNDLYLMKNLLKAEASIAKNPTKWAAKFLSFVTVAREKLQNHLWYLSERLVSLALFSDRTSSDKQTMRRAMLRYHGTAHNMIQEMPASQQLGSKALKDFVGYDSWSMFELLGIDSSFVKLPVAQWPTSDSYRHGKEVVANLPVVNDAAERTLGLATDLNTNKAPTSEAQLQALYRVVKGVREKLHGLATFTELR
uniref:uncharacterized protein n=1 Tax=Myxine glutinosa TaxID=7769 RepID=UPI00358E4C15